MYTSGFEVLNKVNTENLVDYPLNILAQVRRKWYPQIPELKESKESKTGTTVIEFSVQKDGSLQRVHIVNFSGSNSLDAAAIKAITAAAPFSRLPKEYREKRLFIQMHFGYRQPANPEAPVCDGPNLGAHPGEGVILHHVGNGVETPRATYSPDPEYSEQARKSNYQSIVVVGGTVEPDGSFTDLCLDEAAGRGLDEQAMQTIKKWRFQPAKLQGQPVAVRIGVQATFRLY
jgi:TonB family protein